ncbi:MAG: hypothetical protein A2136_06310 [Chloroflexi bacterium RBG_16_54_11]|nr:MAG: hypothetical protein A2136_06310 [Chloroflexi bacterium RBG_16_54_11]
MKLLFIFMDGVGLGRNDPQVNPFVRAQLPNLDGLLDGNKLVANGREPGPAYGRTAIHTRRASLLALDACLGVEGTPQSASGQATLLTGKNVPQTLGYHDGPKPNPIIMGILQQETLFSHMQVNGHRAILLNAFPPRYFKSIESGHRLPGAIAMAAKYAGMHLSTADDLQRGEAISADFTAQGWREQLGLQDAPLLSPLQAGVRLANLSNGTKLAFFEYWLSDVAGHQREMQPACELLETFDAVLGSLLNGWDDEAGLILLTSDHGNLEDLSTRRHTRNDVPLLLIGSLPNRERFIEELERSRGSRAKLDLTDVTPAILKLP